jgi:NADPH-dependent glutamate synthase beta subunit-like oxidoreductase
MPADEEEIREAHLEGIEFITQAIPVKIEAENKKLAIIWNKAEMVDQGEGRRPKPVALEGDIHKLYVDNLITAIGQGADFSFLGEDIGAKIKFERYQILTDDFGQTSEPKIFAGGDIANKTADAISAIADGYKAAKGINNFLKKK